MTTRLKAFFLILFMGLSLNASAWNAMGHRVVATIAYQHLTPAVRAKVDKLVGNFSQEYPQITSLLQMASWPDELRGQRVELFTHWHYIDYTLSADGTQPSTSLIDSDNAVWAVSQIKLVVQNTRANVFEKARFLAFLTHIVGDLHQPLHSVSRVTAAHPEGDKGGNLFSVRRAGGGGSVTLHKLWDDGAGLLDGDESTENVNRLAQQFTTAYPESSFGTKAKDADPEHWAKEGYETAVNTVYATPENQLPSTSYIENEKKAVSQELALAGYRLANLLNTLLTDKANAE